MYRKILGRNDGARGYPGQGLVGLPQHPAERETDWQYDTQQPMASGAAPSHSAAFGHSNDWHASESGSPYQHYDAAFNGDMAGRTPAPLPTAVPATMTAHAAICDFNHSRVNMTPKPASDAAAFRDVSDLNNREFETERAQSPPDPPRPRMPSVNYGPGRLDAGTGADFSLLPDYLECPDSGGVRPVETSPDEDDLYESSTPFMPPPPHSAPVRTAAPQPPMHTTWPGVVVGSSARVVPGVAPSELPTAQTHRGYGQAAELPGDGQQSLLRHQRLNVHESEQKFLLADMASLRGTGGPSENSRE